MVEKREKMLEMKHNILISTLMALAISTPALADQQQVYNTISDHLQNKLTEKYRDTGLYYDFDCKQGKTATDHVVHCINSGPSSGLFVLDQQYGHYVIIPINGKAQQYTQDWGVFHIMFQGEVLSAFVIRAFPKAIGFSIEAAMKAAEQDL